MPGSIFPSHTWYYHDWSILQWNKGSYKFDSTCSYQFSMKDCDDCEHIYSIGRIKNINDYVSLVEKKECFKDKYDEFCAKKQQLVLVINDHKSEIKKLEEEFEMVSNILISNEKSMEEIKESDTRLDPISQKIGRHKFEIKKIMNSVYEINYKKMIKEYTYYLPEATECELMTMEDEICMRQSMHRINVRLSWHYDNSKSQYRSSRQKVNPYVIKIIETIQCTENVKMF